MMGIQAKIKLVKLYRNFSPYSFEKLIRTLMLHKKYLTCISHVYKHFWQVSRLNQFTTGTMANLFVHERLKIQEANSEPIQNIRDGAFCKNG